MDHNAEIGTASHWSYKGISLHDNHIQHISSPHTSHSKNKEFTALKQSLPKKIYALTPTGEVKELPLGATPIDFAYTIHTDIGTHCKGAIVNDKITPLNYTIQEGDMIEILTDKNKYPKKEWLSIAVSKSVRHKIKSYFLSIGENIATKNNTFLQKTEATKPILSKHVHKNTTHNTPSPNTFLIGGEKNMIYHFAKCCHPEEKKNLVAYASSTRDFVIHHKNCLNVLRCDQQKILEVKKIA